MPHRPHSHRVRDIASLAVEMTFASAGWSTEPIRQDYDEDLLVQPTWNNDVEPFKLWVQVKGVLDREESEAWRARRDHAERWLLSREYVVYVVWHLEHGTARYCLPRHQLWHQWDAGLPSVLLKPHGNFDRDAVDTIYWIAFLEHCDHLFNAWSLDIAWDPFSSATELLALAGKKWSAAHILMVAGKLLHRLKILEQDGRLSDGFGARWHAFDGGEKCQELFDKLSQTGVSYFVSRTQIVLHFWILEKTKITPPIDVAHKIALFIQLLQEHGLIANLDIH